MESGVEYKAPLAERLRLSLELIEVASRVELCYQFPDLGRYLNHKDPDLIQTR